MTAKQSTKPAPAGFLDLSNRGALVVGGTRGIGYAVAERFCRAGANVCVVGQKESTVARAVEQLSASGYKTDGLVAEITDPSGNIFPEYGSNF
jgi:3-oxoacyl-[acyl-carrier protein] reductase